jgi:hypothetical protein
MRGLEAGSRYLAATSFCGWPAFILQQRRPQAGLGVCVVERSWQRWKDGMPWIRVMFVFMNGKQVRVKRPETIDGIDVDEFIRRNADPIWLHQNGMHEFIDDDPF